MTSARLPLRLALWLMFAFAAHAAPHQFSRPLMGTGFSITCHTGDKENAQAAAEAAFEEAAAINSIASDYLEESELSKLSHAPVGQPVELSDTLFELLATSRDLAEKTDGRFDPTLGPLTRLWRETRRTRALPGPETLAEARVASGWQNFTLDPATRTITLRRPGMRFDLGGIAKGYAADRMLEVMRKHGITRTSIVAGGDVRLGDPPPGSEGWNVAIKTFDPATPDEILTLADCAVSTSGDLFQFVEIDGTRYSHILDPATGLGLTKRIAVTVIAPTATLSDPLATAACLAGPDEAGELARSLGATRVIVRRP